MVIAKNGSHSLNNIGKKLSQNRKSNGTCRENVFRMRIGEQEHTRRGCVLPGATPAGAARQRCGRVPAGISQPSTLNCRPAASDRYGRP